MTRPIDAAILTAIQQGHTRLRYFAEFEFDGGTTRIWTGLGTITAQSQTWYGAGSLASVEGLEEGDELSPFALKLGLSRLDSAFSGMALSEQYHNRPMTLYVSAVGDDGDLVADPVAWFAGEIIDVEATVGSPDGEVVVVTCENELARLDRTPGLKYTNTQQQLDYSGDLGLEYVTQVVDHRPVWRGGQQAKLGGGPIGNSGGPASGGSSGRSGSRADR